MQKYVAALYAGNRVVTGINHGDAFSKLNQDERVGNIESGFLEPSTGRFVVDDRDFYIKQVCLVRHGHAHGQEPDDDLTELGIRQTQRTAELLSELEGFSGFCSPRLRCRETARIIREVTGIPISVHHDLRDQEEPDDDFFRRIHDLIDSLPARSLVITHSDLICHIIGKTTGRHVGQVVNASITMVDVRRTR